MTAWLDILVLTSTILLFRVWVFYRTGSKDTNRRAAFCLISNPASWNLITRIIKKIGDARSQLLNSVTYQLFSLPSNSCWEYPNKYSQYSVGIHGNIPSTVLAGNIQIQPWSHFNFRLINCTPVRKATLLECRKYQIHQHQGHLTLTYRQNKP